VAAATKAAADEESCRQLDPTGDTESPAGLGAIEEAGSVADNSIRPGILKVIDMDLTVDTGLRLQTTRSDRGY